MPTLDRNGLPLYYETEGSGPALILAHGAGGNAGIWFNQIAHFSATHQVVSFDHRSFGRTPLPSEPISVHHFRDDVLALMDHLNIDRAHLVGQSMGGFTCLRTTLDVPERVLSLTLSATTGGMHNPEPTEAFKNLTTGGSVADTMSAATKANPQLMQLYASIGNFNVNFDWANLSTLLSREDVVMMDDIKNVATPTLIIAGGEDPLFPEALLSSYVPHFQNASIEVVANSGHSPYFEQPEVFNQILASHLAAAE